LQDLYLQAIVLNFCEAEEFGDLACNQHLVSRIHRGAAAAEEHGNAVGGRRIAIFLAGHVLDEEGIEDDAARVAILVDPGDNAAQGDLLAYIG
jgi:hypothetical protein